jgi:hypothetical protein
MLPYIGCWGKNTIKGATQMNGHFLKLHFCILKDHKKNIIVWIAIKILEYFPLIGKITCSNLDTNKKCFYMFKA